MLKEIEFIEVDGEFERRFINEKSYPIFLTNASVKKGHDLGLLGSSLFTDLLKMKALENVLNDTEDEDEAALNAMETFDESKMIHIIYLAFLGANRKSELTYYKFLELYHYTLPETIELYAKLITDLISTDNGFAKGLEQSTKKEKKSLWPLSFKSKP